MGSAWREVRAGGLAVGVVLAMTLSGGVAAADPDPGAPPPAPSAASSATEPAANSADSTLGPTSPDSTASGAPTGTSDGPTSKVGSAPTAGVSSSGGAQTSVRADEDALSKELADLTQQSADIAEAEQSVQYKLDAMQAAPGDTISISDMFQMQMMMNHLSQMSELNASVVTAMNTTMASMARGVKGG